MDIIIAMYLLEITNPIYQLADLQLFLYPKRQTIQHQLDTLEQVRRHPELAHFIPILIKQMTDISGDHFIAFCKSSKDRYYGFDMLFIAITIYNQIHGRDIISTITQELNSLKSGQKHNKYQAQTAALNLLLNNLIKADLATNLRLASLGIAQSAGPKIPAPSFLPGKRKIQIFLDNCEKTNVNINYEIL